MSADPQPKLDSTKFALQRSIFQQSTYSLAKNWNTSERRDMFGALSLAVRDRLVERRLESEERVRLKNAKCLYYLSMEFLMGGLLGNNLYNLETYDICKETLIELGG